MMMDGKDLSDLRKKCIDYSYCEFFSDLPVGGKFYLLGQAFVKNSDTTAEGPLGSRWVFLADHGKLRQADTRIDRA